jgi:multicomponent K+:H+ antiporter subunit G
MTADMLPAWLLLPISLLLILGGLLTLLGSLGLLRMKTFYQRMHPPSMGNTLGAGCVLIASMLVSSGLAGRPVVHELLITVLIVTTSPITAMLVMGAAMHRVAARRGRDEPS